MSNPARLRLHPQQRFADSQHAFDLRGELEQLRAENHDGQNGHRSKTLSHRANVTQVLFDWDEGGTMREHSARGVVTILCLQGALEIETASETVQLQDLDIFTMDANVPHSVRALKASAMLLTVALSTS